MPEEHSDQGAAQQSTRVSPGEPITDEWANSLVSDIGNIFGRSESGLSRQDGGAASLSVLATRVVEESGDSTMARWEFELNDGTLRSFSEGDSGGAVCAHVPVIDDAELGTLPIKVDPASGRRPRVLLPPASMGFDSPNWVREWLIVLRFSVGEDKGKVSPGSPRILAMQGSVTGSGNEWTVAVTDPSANPGTYIPQSLDGEDLEDEDGSEPAPSSAEIIVPLVAVVLQDETNISPGDETTGIHRAKIQHLRSGNIDWNPDRRWAHRNAYNTGDGKAVLVVNPDDNSTHQEQGQPFRMRRVKGEGSTADRVEITVEYDGESIKVGHTEPQNDGELIINQLDESGDPTELGRISWGHGWVNEAGQVVVNIPFGGGGGGCPSGASGTISLQEEDGTSTETVIKATDGCVETIMDGLLIKKATFYVCDGGSVVEKTFLTI